MRLHVLRHRHQIPLHSSKTNDLIICRTQSPVSIIPREIFIQPCWTLTAMCKTSMHLLFTSSLVFLTGSYSRGYTPLLLTFIYLFSSLITYAVYHIDKSAAMEGRWRVSEKTLHFWSLLCGWPGAIIAQEHLRHKTKKKDFRRVFWVTVILNCGVLAWLHTKDGMMYVRVGITIAERHLIELLGPGPGSKIVIALSSFQT